MTTLWNVRRARWTNPWHAGPAPPRCTQGRRHWPPAPEELDHPNSPAGTRTHLSTRPATRMPFDGPLKRHGPRRYHYLLRRSAPVRERKERETLTFARPEAHPEETADYVDLCPDGAWAAIPICGGPLLLSSVRDDLSNRPNPVLSRSTRFVRDDLSRSTDPDLSRSTGCVRNDLREAQTQT